MIKSTFTQYFILLQKMYKIHNYLNNYKQIIRFLNHVLINYIEYYN